MKLSRTGWNNVIIFSVMIIIIIINTTNDKLFSDSDNQANAGQQLLLPEHSVILALAIKTADDKQLLFERVGRSWQHTGKGVLLSLTDQQVEQLMFSWQQASGLVQASDVIIDESKGILVQIDIAANEQRQQFTLYPLTDQLLIYKHVSDTWLAFPAAIAKQLIPITQL